MSTLKKARPSSHLRTAAVALFGLATIATLIGVVLAVDRAEQTTAAGPSAIPPSHPSALAGPSVIPFPPPVASRPAEAPVMPLPAPSAASEPAPTGEKSMSRGEVRIYNNGTIRGLATRAAREFSAAGWTVVEVGNFARGTVPTTTVYYQEGTDQRAQAEAIAAQFGMRVEPRFAGISRLPSGVIVIVTNDYAH